VETLRGDRMTDVGRVYARINGRQIFYEGPIVRTEGMLRVEDTKTGEVVEISMQNVEQIVYRRH